MGMISGRSFHKKMWIGIAGFIVLFGILQVDVYPIITNDSLAYIRHSENLSSTGLIQLGYRQFGYPIWIRAVNVVASFFGMEPLAILSMLQRVMLVGITAAAVYTMRLGALPIAIVVLVPTYTVFSNLVLTEGLGIPLSIAATLLLIVTVYERKEREISLHVTTIGILLSATIAVILSALRFHYILITFAILAFLLVLAVIDKPLRHLIVITVSVATLFLALMLTTLSFENRSEHGVFFPSVRGERALFWTNWQTVVRPNMKRIATELPDIYKDGNPYSFIREVDSEKSYKAQRASYKKAIGQILDTAGTTKMKERAKAFMGVLTGGRMDDIHSLTTSSATDILPGQLESRIHRNSYAKRHGYAKFNTQYNDGRQTRGALLGSCLIPDLPYPHIFTLFRILFPAAIMTLIIGIARSRTRILSSIGLALVFAYAAVGGWYNIDNLRFLIPMYVSIITMAGAVAQSFACRFTDKSIET